MWIYKDKKASDKSNPQEIFPSYGITYKYTQHISHMESFNALKKKWHIFFKLIPFLVCIFLLKLIFHNFSLEVISLNALFTSLIAATTFLIGFLIAGVISDYKEGEKMPGELASSLEAIYDEAYILNKNKKSKVTENFLKFHLELSNSINDWFYKKERSLNIMNKIHGMNDFFSEFEGMTQAAFVSRMKQEQSNIRKIITRVHTIRETSFVQSAYAVVESLAFFLIVGLLILKLEPFYESVFFSLIVSFLVLYMLFLIKDLDDPFEYEKYGEIGNEVSLKPLHDLISRISEKKAKNN